MCTVVVRWAPGQPTRILALRDELTSRSFDEPDRWWPEYGDVVGGRDRTAGGTWCANRIGSGVTALVLNRPQRRVAADRAPSRGVLPLLGVTHEWDWPDHVELDGMASFALVLAGPQRLTAWDFDGEHLTSTDHDAGTHMVTSGGREDGKADRFLDAFEQASFPDGWRDIVEQNPPQSDLAALTVRHERDGVVYATVFGQLIDAEPGRLQVEHSRTPWTAGSWTTVRL